MHSLPYDVISGTTDGTNVEWDGIVAQAICEKLSNKVQAINKNSTEEQYPSAKAVYDFVGSGLGGSGSDASAKRHYNTFSVLGDSYSTFVDFVTKEEPLTMESVE